MWKSISADGIRKANITATINLHKSWIGKMFNGAERDRNQTKENRIEKPLYMYPPFYNAYSACSLNISNTFTCLITVLRFFFYSFQGLCNYIEVLN